MLYFSLSFLLLNQGLFLPSNFFIDLDFLKHYFNLFLGLPQSGLFLLKLYLKSVDILVGLLESLHTIFKPLNRSEVFPDLFEQDVLERLQKRQIAGGSHEVKSLMDLLEMDCFRFDQLMSKLEVMDELLVFVLQLMFFF